MESTHTRRELSFDGKGVNGPDEYRSRLATFTSEEAADKYGPIFEAAPELLAACRGIAKAESRFLESAAIKYGGVVQVDVPGKVWDAMLAAIAKAKKGE